MSKIFVSANSKDHVFISKIVSALEEAGHDTFYYKKDIRTSDTWPIREAKGLDWADYIICFVSSDFLVSRYCMDEMAVGYAQDNLITVMIEKCKLPGQFAARNYLLDLSNELSQGREGLAVSKFSHSLSAFFAGRFDSFDKTPEVLFQKGELGIVFATFNQVSGTKLTPAKDWLASINKQLEKELKKAKARIIGVDRVIDTEEEARLYLIRSGASLILWGSISALNRLQINLTVADKFSWALPKNTYLQGVFSAKKVNKEHGFVKLKHFNAQLSDGSDVDYIVKVLLGMVQHCKGNFRSALELFLKAIKACPIKRALMLKLNAVHYLAGMCYAELSEYSTAIRHITDSVKLNPQSEYAYCNRGICYYAIGEYQKAINDFSKAIAIAPNLATAYRGRGESYSVIQQYEKAISDYNESIELAPNEPAVFYNRAGAYRMLDSYPEAFADYDSAISLKPDFWLAYRDRGLLSYALGRLDKALMDFNHCVRVDSSLAEGFFWRGVVYAESTSAPFSSGKYERLAINDLSSAIKLNSKYAEAYFYRGRTRAELKEYTNALKDFSKAIELDNELAVAYYHRGLTHSVVGMRTNAIGDLQKYLKLSGDDNTEVKTLLMSLRTSI